MSNFFLSSQITNSVYERFHAIALKKFFRNNEVSIPCRNGNSFSTGIRESEEKCAAFHAELFLIRIITLKVLPTEKLF